jgi:alkylhydroperoxidase family enzyme
MTEKEEPNYCLDVTLSIKRKSGVTVNISTRCSNWNFMQKFLNDFENTLLKGKDGKA